VDKSERQRILVPFQGGLGNQLFQLSAGLNLLRNFNCQPLFTDFFLRHRTWLDFGHSNDSSRKLMIRELLNDDEFTESFGHFDAMAIAFRTLTGSNKVLREPDNRSSIFEHLTNETYVIRGWFQEYQFVSNIQDLLIARMRSTSRFRDVVSALVETSIAVHVRLGDYYHDQETRNHHGLTEMSYYHNSIQHLLRTIDAQRIVIVSDEPELALKLLCEDPFGTDIPMTCVIGDEHQDLATLANCAGIVISNSTFSWWAGFLGSVLHGSLVVAPTPWLSVKSRAEDDLIPSTWTTMQRLLDKN